jgi:hypothetical protein
MGYFSVQFLCTFEGKYLWAVLLDIFMGCCTVFIWGVVAHISYNCCCSAQFAYGLLQCKFVKGLLQRKVFIWAFVMHNLYGLF